MIASVKAFFAQFVEPATRDAGATEAHALQIATAALLLEMMRMDDHIAPAEQRAIADALRRQFGLNDEEFQAVLEVAEATARSANDYYQFTSLINRECTLDQKVRIVENLWRVAMADGRLDAHELHLMRKLADLLYVGHADYIAAKERARAAMNLPAQ